MIITDSKAGAPWLLACHERALSDATKAEGIDGIPDLKPRVVDAGGRLGLEITRPPRMSTGHWVRYLLHFAMYTADAQSTRPVRSAGKPPGPISYSAMERRGRVRDLTESTEQMLRVSDVVARLRLSARWVRGHFAHVPGVLKVISPPKRSRRSYSIMLIPESVLLQEMRKLAQ